jgi:hypothetical protein
MKFINFFPIFIGNFCPPGSGPGLLTRIRIQGPRWIRIRICNTGETNIMSFLVKKCVQLFLYTISVWYQIPGSDHWACINIMVITLSCSKKYYPLNTHLHHEWQIELSTGVLYPMINKHCPCIVPFCPCHGGSKGPTGNGFYVFFVFE